MRFHLPLANRGGRRAAFTLIELLMVISIIGILAAVGLPALKGFNKSNAVSAADRQLLDDVASARQLAIANHTDIYMLFVPPASVGLITAASNTTAFTDLSSRQLATNLLTMQYAGYALYAERSVGDQPGQSSPRYLTPWHRLPDGMFIPKSKFTPATYTPVNLFGVSTNGVTNFDYRAFPFPQVTTNTLTNRISLPYIQFTYLGQLTTRRDRNNSAEVIPLARGSIFTNADLSADVLEIPPGNSTNIFNHVRIDWLTGRAKVEQQQFQ